MELPIINIIIFEKLKAEFNIPYARPFILSLQFIERRTKYTVQNQISMDNLKSMVLI